MIQEKTFHHEEYEDHLMAYYAYANHFCSSNVHEDLAITPVDESSRGDEGAVTRPTGRREYVLVGSTAAFPAADACRSSNRTLFGTGNFVAELLHIKKLDKRVSIYELSQ
ncbi:hypothetical protein [Methylotuvimicrobium buryatense]|uniref:Uncharacterized protein n=1 Tax=Methylotuvimicrobium buryatense TaxID=95641 RepID=A0A4P9UPD5_METBY|nr:hypothetical protein [Methylotuvimicrobium buryatense]QCW83127.1 hypothetical protein EQU24_13450 [Methylotuvimicrobium buryatense]